jgi:photosystem II stability/assembly factor-like uncharacterized protein
VAPRGPSARRWLLTALLSSSVLAAAAPGRGQDPPREQQIADLERQIRELTRKLEELRRPPASPSAQAAAGIPDGWLPALTWRLIGPATMGGRITALAVCEDDPSTYWVATASGGLLKTTNNGVTFEHQFDHEATVSIGDVAVAPSDRNVVWVGTGEANPRNSVSWGDGVYKSTDGGKTWKNMGLKGSFQIGRIAIHPKNPDVVYVAALGRLYGPNEERGLFKTADGGKTWERILYVDDKTGAVDVRLSPADPDTLLAALWERRRDGFDSHRGEPLADGYDTYDPARKWGPGGGLFKSTDGGKTFHKLTQGLPGVPTGRIGLDYCRKNPNVVFAAVDTEKVGMGNPPPQPFLGVATADAPGGARVEQVTPASPAAKAGLQVGDVLTAIDGREVRGTQGLTALIQGRRPGEKVKLAVRRGPAAVEVTAELGKRPDAPAPQTPQQRRRPNMAWFGGQRENVQDAQGPNGQEYGGVFRSADGGETWARVNSLNPRPIYFSQVRVDPSDEKRVYVLGVALHRSDDGGKTFKPDGGNGAHPDHHALWIDPRDGRHMVLGTDGGFYATYDRMAHWDYLNTTAIGQFYHVALDGRRPYRAYGGLQDNGSWGGPSRALHGSGPDNADWIVVNGGDGFRCAVDLQDPDIVYAEMQDGGMVRRNLRTGEFASVKPRDVPGLPPYRFNWSTPFLVSSHNPGIFLCAGNFVFRSVERGDHPRLISPEIARTKRGTGSALAESPRNPDVLWAGTDDGNLWGTRDGGGKWVNVADRVGLPGPRWVASIEASRFAEGRAYVAFDGHRSDDDEPYLFATEDFGQTWRPLRGNLPAGSTRVLREDAENENLLYAGTEFAVWASVDRGATWTKVNNNLPTVAVHELAVHPTAGEVVAATHGRSLWVLDVTPLRQLTAEVRQAKAALLRPAPATRWHYEPSRDTPFGGGSRRFVGQNPPPGAPLYYALTKKADKASLRILDYAGRLVRELPAKAEPGLHRADWDLARAELRPPAPPPESLERPGAARARWEERLHVAAAAAGPGLLALVPPRPAGPGGRPRPSLVPPGMYRVVLTVDGEEHSQGLRLEADPNAPPAVIAADEEPREGQERDGDGAGEGGR